MEDQGFTKSIDEKVAKTAYLMISNSYDDYIGARVLINNHLPKQGVTLASSSIEKYLKAFLIILEVDYEWFHLDNLTKAQKCFNGTPYEKVLSFINPVFLDILGRSYKWRYYDKIKTPESIGFFPSQLLGELDELYSRMELMLKVPQSLGWQTNYARDKKEFRKELYENNFILSNIEKQTFMTLPAMGYGIYYNPNTILCGIAQTKYKIQPEYKGQMMLINVQEDMVADSGK